MADAAEQSSQVRSAFDDKRMPDTGIA